MNDVLAAYESMCKSHSKWSELVPVQLTTQVSNVAWPEEMKQRIQAFDPDYGWVAWQRHAPPLVAWLKAKQAVKELIAPLNDNNWLIEAEFAKTGASLHVYRDGITGWHVLEIVEHAIQKQPGISPPILAESVSQLGKHAKGVAKLRYRVFWMHDPEQGYRARLARFVGLDLVPSP